MDMCKTLLFLHLHESIMNIRTLLLTSPWYLKESYTLRMKSQNGQRYSNLNSSTKSASSTSAHTTRNFRYRKVLKKCKKNWMRQDVFGTQIHNNIQCFYNCNVIFVNTNGTHLYPHQSIYGKSSLRQYIKRDSALSGVRFK